MARDKHIVAGKLLEDIRKRKWAPIGQGSDLSGFFKLIPSLIAGIISLSFAFYVVIVFFRTEHPIIVWSIFIPFAFIINVVSFLFSRKHPERSYSLGFILVSAALAIFILSFLFDSVGQSWEISLGLIDKIYNLIGETFVVGPIYAILFLLGLTLSFALGVMLYEKAKYKISKILALLLAGVFCTVWLYFLDISFSPMFGYSGLHLAGRIIKLLFSFSPIHWIYLLFIKSKRPR